MDNENLLPKIDQPKSNTNSLKQQKNRKILRRSSSKAKSPKKQSIPKEIDNPWPKARRDKFPRLRSNSYIPKMVRRRGSELSVRSERGKTQTKRNRVEILNKHKNIEKNFKFESKDSFNTFDIPALSEQRSNIIKNEKQPLEKEINKKKEQKNDSKSDKRKKKKKASPSKKTLKHREKINLKNSIPDISHEDLENKMKNWKNLIETREKVYKNMTNKLNIQESSKGSLNEDYKLSLMMGGNKLNSMKTKIPKLKVSNIEVKIISELELEETFFEKIYPTPDVKFKSEISRLLNYQQKGENVWTCPGKVLEKLNKFSVNKVSESESGTRLFQLGSK